MSASPDRAGSGQVRPVVALRPLANPLPLGFLGQALASWAFASLQLSWLSPAQSHPVALAVLVFTVPLQGLAAVLGFLARDPVAGTGPALLAGGWAVVGAVTLMSPPGATSAGMGVLLLGVAATLLVPAAASLGRVAAAAVLVVAVPRFAITGVAELVGGHGWLQAAGWAGLVLCAVSAYAALAFELEAATGRLRLPIGRIAGRSTPLDDEAGVRRNL